MNPKRILMISYHTCPLASWEGKESGGMNVYVYELAKSLGKSGIAVDVITRRQEEHADRIVEVSENFRVVHLDAGPIGDVDKHKLVQHIPQFVSSYVQFQKEHSLSYDLIHAHYYQSGLIGREIQQTLPMVMSFHTLGLMKNLVARNQSEQESSERINAEFSLVQSSAAIITSGQMDKQYLQYLYGADTARVHQIPPGVNTDLFHPQDHMLAKQKIKINPSKRNILFVGRIEPLKGIDVILYALKILKSKRPDLKLNLCIVGGDVSQHIEKWSSSLRQLAHIRRILHLEDEVTFIGQKQQHELPDYYNSADVVVMPSHYESFGMAAAEALACGTPVITTNVTGMSYLIGDNREALISTVNNPLLLASQLETLLTDTDVYNKIKLAISKIHTPDWEYVTKQMIQVYSMVL